MTKIHSRSEQTQSWAKSQKLKPTMTHLAPCGPWARVTG